MNPIAEKYLRKNFLPQVFCPGCGDGMIVQAIAHAAEELAVGDDLTMTAGIGCSAWIPMYLHVDVLKGLHGRAIPAAIGLKASRPARKVITVTGDGDCLAIGGNHLLHACRRNIDMTVIMVNNQIYAMTGGQVAPSTPFQGKTQTTPYGSVENKLDGCKVAIACGATHVARWSTAHIKQLTKAIKTAISHKGFSYIEVISQCPVQTGRYLLGNGSPQFNFQWIKDHCVKQEDPAKWEEVEAQGNVPVGDFLKIEKPEFMAEVLKMNQRVKEAQAKGGDR